MKALYHSRSGRAAETLTPSSQKQRPPRVPKENVDPSPAAAAAPPPESSPFRSPSSGGAKPLAPKNRSPLPPRPPQGSSNPLKRKLSLETLPENGVPPASASESGVQVIVRIRPPNGEEEEGDLIVQKTSSNSVSILDHTFTFDSVADVGSTQASSHFINSKELPCWVQQFYLCIWADRQRENLYDVGTAECFVRRQLIEQRARINSPREQAKHSDKQLIYHCCCSFLEASIYNEQITDLLDPTQRNLQIREDTKVGVYVDNLTEENVCTMKDVTQLLIKGLANRRTGATSVNAESSRSHCVFTCIVKSQSKNTADGFNSLRISRINLVDLAGSERQKLTDAAGERLREAGNINRSLSQLGNLINILAKFHSPASRGIFLTVIPS
uniref:Kinesin-like protein n=1 Tax=Ananas comosus var. bracteatus TaxID=296719 RepID=A0A6V7P1K3_ANACO|nr:unnamed protein product [Ananas comosus var. bracteatus]